MYKSCLYKSCFPLQTRIISELNAARNLQGPSQAEIPNIKAMKTFSKSRHFYFLFVWAFGGLQYVIWYLTPWWKWNTSLRSKYRKSIQRSQKSQSPRPGVGSLTGRPQEVMPAVYNEPFLLLADNKALTSIVSALLIIKKRRSAANEATQPAISQSFKCLKQNLPAPEYLKQYIARYI